MSWPSELRKLQLRKLLGLVLHNASQCAAFQVGETLNTLEFASRAMRVEAEDSITRLLFGLDGLL